ncbi:MAG: nicotinate-nucleotide adenylyltransferase [Magnetospirillum sp. WYHS-4]
MTRRVGLLGGSFNPAHAGHRHVSLHALRRLRLDEVWWLVSPQNPLKPADGMAPLGERLAEAARIAAHPRIRPTAIETELGTRYTADTLKALRNRFPGLRFIWLMGADNLVQMPRWRRWMAIFHTVPVAVFARPSYSLRALSGTAARHFAGFRIDGPGRGALADRIPPAWAFLGIPPHPESSTRIRAAGTAGKERKRR